MVSNYWMDGVIKMINRSFFNFSAIIGSLIIAISAVAAGPSEAPRIGKDEVKGMLGNSGIVIVDVRQPKDWDNSRSKIKGAVRKNPGDVEEWIDGIPKNKTLIFYCA